LFRKGIKMKLVLILLITALVVACSQVVVNQDAKKFYKLMLPITSGSKQGIGTIVLPKQDSYTISVETPSKSDYISFRTCSRELVVTDQSQKRFIIKYTPNVIESAGTCPAEISVLNVNGQNAMGYIDFQDNSDLNAIITCGSYQYMEQSAGICQERQGLIEKVTFGTEVIARPTCVKLDKEKGMEFTFVMPLGICPVMFLETGPRHRTFRLTLRGYEQILMSI
jgi:hypothetical protein